jgi:hypothetical protein
LCLGELKNTLKYDFYDALVQIKKNSLLQVAFTNLEKNYTTSYPIMPPPAKISTKKTSFSAFYTHLYSNHDPIHTRYLITKHPLGVKPEVSVFKN